jgi:hypothetical protein
MENYTDQDYGYGFGPYTDYGYVRKKIRINTESVKIRISPKSYGSGLTGP